MPQKGHGEFQRGKEIVVLYQLKSPVMDANPGMMLGMVDVNVTWMKMGVRRSEEHTSELQSP